MAKKLLNIALSGETDAVKLAAVKTRSTEPVLGHLPKLYCPKAPRLRTNRSLRAPRQCRVLRLVVPEACQKTRSAKVSS